MLTKFIIILQGRSFIWMLPQCMISVTLSCWVCCTMFSFVVTIMFSIGCLYLLAGKQRVYFSNSICLPSSQATSLLIPIIIQIHQDHHLFTTYIWLKTDGMNLARKNYLLKICQLRRCVQRRIGTYNWLLSLISNYIVEKCCYVVIFWKMVHIFNMLVYSLNLIKKKERSLVNGRAKIQPKPTVKFILHGIIVTFLLTSAAVKGNSKFHGTGNHQM